jgi:hypothetical protein
MVAARVERDEAISKAIGDYHHTFVRPIVEVVKEVSSIVNLTTANVKGMAANANL